MSAWAFKKKRKRKKERIRRRCFYLTNSERTKKPGKVKWVIGRWYTVKQKINSQ